jgi:hypothetical protein
MAIEAKTAVPSAAANGKNGHSLISDAKFRQLYGLALRLQVLAQGQNSAGNGFAAHTAALAGIAADLRDGDVLVAEATPSIGRALAAELPGEFMQAQNGAGTAERVTAAVAGAAATRIRKNGAVAVIFLPGDDVAPLMEDVRMVADRAKLPVLFVEEAVELNLPARRARLNGSVQSEEMPAIPVDAQDVIAMYRVAHESIARARLGSGPTRILCLQPPPVRGRNGKLVEQDAVDHLEHWLLARGLPAQEWRREIVAGLETRG